MAWCVRYSGCQTNAKVPVNEWETVALSKTYLKTHAYGQPVHRAVATILSTPPTPTPPPPLQAQSFSASSTEVKAFDCWSSSSRNVATICMIGQSTNRALTEAPRQSDRPDGKEAFKCVDGHSLHLRRRAGPPPIAGPSYIRIRAASTSNAPVVVFADARR